MKKAESNEKKPFFARFLENQKVRTGIKSGKMMTMKYPSDDDEPVWI